MRRLAALAVIAALATLVPMVALASLSGGSCCAAKNEPPPAPMSCCTKTQCSMSESGAMPIAPNQAESTPAGAKIASPGPALVTSDEEIPAVVSSADFSRAADAAVATVPVDRRLALLSTYLI